MTNCLDLGNMSIYKKDAISNIMLIMYHYLHWCYLSSRQGTVCSCWSWVRGRYLWLSELRLCCCREQERCGKRGLLACSDTRSHTAYRTRSMSCISCLNRSNKNSGVSLRYQVLFVTNHSFRLPLILFTITCTVSFELHWVNDRKHIALFSKTQNTLK